MSETGESEDEKTKFEDLELFEMFSKLGGKACLIPFETHIPSFLIKRGKTHIVTSSIKAILRCIKRPFERKRARKEGD